MQIFSIVLGIAYFGMGIVQISAIADGINTWLGWDGLLAGFLAFILGYFPLIGSICGVAGAYYAWGWGLIPSIILFFWYIPLIIILFIISSFQNFFESKRYTEEKDTCNNDNYIKSNSSFFDKFINGDISLAAMFWIYGIATSVLCNFIINSKVTEYFFSYLYYNYDLIGVKVIGITYDTILIVYTVILCIGLWRSANKYTGSFIWIVIAKFFSILWMLSIIIFVADIFGLVNMQLPGATEDLPQWRLDNYKKSIDSLITP